MILYINTTADNLIEIGLKARNKFIYKKKFGSLRTQAEKLLPAIDRMLKAKQIKLSGLEAIETANQGGSFTSLRVGVVTANALAYALGISVRAEKAGAEKAKSGELIFKPVRPEYGGEPSITVEKPVN